MPRTLDVGRRAEEGRWTSSGSSPSGAGASGSRILVFALPFAAATSVILSLPNLYRSTATVLVERQQVPESFVRSTVTSELETRLQTISQEVLSRARLEGLINRFGLYADQRTASAHRGDRRADAPRHPARDQGATGRQSATVAFALSYRGRDPRTVALVTNTLASFYVEENLKARERQASGTTEFLKAQIAETKKRLDEQERRVSEFKRRYVGELPQQMQANLATLEALNTQLRLNSDNQVRAAERRQALAAQLAEAEAFAQPLAVAPGRRRAAGPEPPAAPPRAAQAGADRGADALHRRPPDRDPPQGRDRRRRARSCRRQARPDVKSESAPAPAAPASPYVLRLREALHAAEAELKILKAEDQRLRARSRPTSPAWRTRHDGSRSSRTSRGTTTRPRSRISRSSKRYEEAQLAESMEQRQKGEQFRILDPALPSTVTAAPNRLRLAPDGLGALAWASRAGAAMLAEMLDTSFHSADELRAFTTVPVLVSIPRIAHRGRPAAAAAPLPAGRGGGACWGWPSSSAPPTLVAHGNEQLVRMLGRDMPHDRWTSPSSVSGSRRSTRRRTLGFST